MRVGVVGLGYWGPNLVRNLAELPDVELVYFCDLRPDVLDLTSRRYPGVPCTMDLSAVLEDPSVDAVVIATPVSTHYSLALRALEAGKHVFVEKPFASSSSEAGLLVEEAKRRKLVVMPGHTFLYSPPVTAIKALIDADELGEIFFISTSRVNLGLHQSDSSVIWDLAPHDFSILRYWLEETPRYVTAACRSCVIPSVPDVAFITLEYDSGVICHVELSWLAPSKLRRTSIVGSRKMLLYDDTSNEPVRVFDSGVNLKDPATFGEYRMTYRSGDIVSPHVPATEPLLLEMTDFCEAVRFGRQPRSSAALGIEVVRMIEAVDRSLQSDGARIDVAAATGPGESRPARAA